MYAAGINAALMAWPNWTILLANISVTTLAECWSIFHVVHGGGQMGQLCSQTNSIRHKFRAIYVVLAVV